MKPAFVVDSSVALAWCFHEEATPATIALFHRMADDIALVPSWWFLELSNVLVLGEKKRRITPAEITEFIEIVDRFNLEIDNEGPGRAFTHLLPSCRTYNLTSYDALYLDLAIRRQLPLATLDKDLRTAAKKLGVKLLGI